MARRANKYRIKNITQKVVTRGMEKTPRTINHIDLNWDKSRTDFASLPNLSRRKAMREDPSSATSLMMPKLTINASNITHPSKQ
jgi:hypothetical protein